MSDDEHNLEGPRVLIGIATRNRSELLSKALHSLQDQSIKRKRVAVIDDASTDGTVGMHKEFPEVDWTRWEEAQGYVAARNLLMTTATEEYYVSIDDDSWFLVGDEIEVAVRFLESQKDVAAVAFDILSPDASVVTERGGSVEVSTYVGCGHVLKLDLVREVGYYARFPGRYGFEEADLSLRLMNIGRRVVKLVGVHVWHDKTQISRDELAQYRSLVSNDLAIVFMREPAVSLVPTLVWKLGRHLVFAVRSGRGRAYVGGVSDGLMNIAAAFRQRAPVSLKAIIQARRLSRNIGK